MWESIGEWGIVGGAVVACSLWNDSVRAISARLGKGRHAWPGPVLDWASETPESLAFLRAHRPSGYVCDGVAFLPSGAVARICACDDDDPACAFTEALADDRPNGDAGAVAWAGDPWA